MQRILFDSFSPSKWETIKLFNRSIRNDPSLAEHVKSFDLYDLYGLRDYHYFSTNPPTSEAVVSDRRQALAYLLAQLRGAVRIEFSYGSEDLSAIFWTEVVSDPQRFERLRSLRIDVLNPDTELESIRGILPLRHLPNLTELVVCWFPSSSVVEPPSHVVLPSIRSLTFGGSDEIFADASMAKLVTSCPNLKYLAIEPDFEPGAAVAILSAIPSTLTKLSLPYHDSVEVCRLLPRLSSLESLDLGEMMDAEELLQYLAELCNLSSLTLGNHSPFAVDDCSTEKEKAIVAELIDGPHQLPALSRLYLRFVRDSSIDEFNSRRLAAPDGSEASLVDRDPEEVAMQIWLEWVLAKAKERGIRVLGWESAGL